MWKRLYTITTRTERTYSYCTYMTRFSRTQNLRNFITLLSSFMQTQKYIYGVICTRKIRVHYNRNAYTYPRDGYNTHDVFVCTIFSRLNAVKIWNGFNDPRLKAQWQWLICGLNGRFNVSLICSIDRKNRLSVPTFVVAFTKIIQ